MTGSDTSRSREQVDASEVVVARERHDTIWMSSSCGRAKRSAGILLELVWRPGLFKAPTLAISADL
jgi:hypothetical protein